MHSLSGEYPPFGAASPVFLRAKAQRIENLPQVNTDRAIFHAHHHALLLRAMQEDRRDLMIDPEAYAVFTAALGGGAQHG